MSSNSTFKKDVIINVTEAVNSRKVYFNQSGVDMIADLRRFLEDEYYNKTGEVVQLSLPALIHTVMGEYIKLMNAKGYDIGGYRREEEEEA